MKDGHHVGRNHFVHGCNLNLPFPNYCRIVYIDACKLHWCAIDSVAFHSFAWPQNVGKAKSIVRTLFANHCDWVDVSIVRGRCFGHHRNCFTANRALENLLWNWSKLRRPYVAHEEYKMATCIGDSVPKWLGSVMIDWKCCQCCLLGSYPKGRHRSGAL